MCRLLFVSSPRCGLLRADELYTPPTSLQMLIYSKIILAMHSDRHYNDLKETYTMNKIKRVSALLLVTILALSVLAMATPTVERSCDGYAYSRTTKAGVSSIGCRSICRES